MLLLFWWCHCAKAYLIIQFGLSLSIQFSVDHSVGDTLGNLYNGSTCLISLSSQDLEETTSADDYQMDSLWLHMWFPFWVACTWKGFTSFCNTTCHCCRESFGWCKTLLFAVNRYASLCSFVCHLVNFFHFEKSKISKMKSNI